MMTMTYAEFWCFVSKRLGGVGVPRHEQSHGSSGFVSCDSMVQLLKFSRVLRQAKCISDNINHREFR